MATFFFSDQAAQTSAGIGIGNGRFVSSYDAPKPKIKGFGQWHKHA